MSKYNMRSSEKKKPKLEKEDLIEKIWCDVVNGVSRYQIKKKLEKDAYEGHKTSTLSRSSHFNYIAEAYNNCKPELIEEKERQRDLFYERILSVYSDAIDVGDRSNALKALEMAMRLSGLDKQSTKTVEISNEKDGNVKILFGFDE